MSSSYYNVDDVILSTYGTSPSTGGSGMGDTAASAASTASYDTPAAATASAASTASYDTPAAATASSSSTYTAATSTTSLTAIRSTEFGDQLYVDDSNDNQVYILKDGDTSNTPILIKDGENAAFGLYEDYSMPDWISTRKVYAVEESTYTSSVTGTTVNGYALAIVSQWGSSTDNLESSYELVYVSETGQIDWMTSTTSTSDSAIMNAEAEFGEDLNGDGQTGIDSSSFTQKTTDVTGDLLFTDSLGNLYIKPASGELISVVDPWNGDPVSLDRFDSWGDGSSSSETLKVTRWDNDTATDTSDDKYLVLAKDTYTMAGLAPTEDYVIYKVDLEGKIDWMADWNPSLGSYEEDFSEDLNGDGVIGVNAANIAFVTTDAASPEGTPGNARLKRDAVDKTLYIDDAGTLLTIVDEWGTSPSLEYESTWEGGSYKSEAYAVEKKSDGTYCLAIKNTDSYMAGSMWNIYSLTKSGSNAVLSWTDSAWTQSISGYEVTFGQDMNGDGFIGVDTSNLTDITTDTSGNLLKKDADGAIYITDSEGNNPMAITDPYGGAPSLEWESSWTEGSYKSEAIAVTLIDDTVDYYNLAVKNTNTYGTETNIDWQIYKISLEGEIDWMGSVYTTSITPWEGPTKFNQDLNMDGDASGTVNVSDYGTDTDGVTLGKADGMLYLRDEGNDIAINDGWIEGSSNWGDGSWSSTAIAADKHSDGYYQLAVKQENSYTDYWSSGTYNSTGTLVSTVDWQIYAINTSGNVLWDKTTWTQSIGKFETNFNQDLDGDGTIGLDMSTITVANTDTFGWKLRKDTAKNLYVTDSDGNNLVSLGDEWGALNFDYEYNWGSGSSKSEAIAAEKNTDGTISVVVKNSGTDSWDGNNNSWSDYQILEFSSSGVIDWMSSYTWTQDIKPYEATFGQDIDGDGSIGLDLTTLVEAGNDSVGDLLKKDAAGNSFYILDDQLPAGGSALISITEDWGGSAQLEYSSSWDGGSWKQEAIAVESLTYTNKNNATVNGYVIAIKNTSTYEGENWVDWELKYTNDKGIIDWGMSTWTSSIKNFEPLFGAGQDLDGDGYSGLSTESLVDITTDTAGASLKKDSENSLYIIDGTDIILISDEWGGTTTFDYEYSGGTGSDIYYYSSSAYAVEDTTDPNGNKNYLLAVKNIDTFGSSSQESWQTYTIKEKNAGAGDWYLDWMTSSWSKGIAKKESIFGQDLNGNGTIEDGSSITTTKIITDTSDGGVTGAGLGVDSEGSLYIIKGESKIAIVDDFDNAVNFDWQYSWGDFTNKSESYAVEGIDSNSDGTVDNYKLAIKHTESDAATGLENIQWETITIATTGIVDWSTFTWGESDIHEQDLNQDLNLDGDIWSTDKLTLTVITTDSVDSTLYLDANNNAYIQAEGSSSKSAVLDETGNLISFSNSWSYDDYSSTSSLYGVKDVTVGGIDYYKLLIKHEDINSGTTTNFWETINVVKSTMKIDWSTTNWYDDPKKLESVFNLELDGVEGIYSINSSNTTPVGTDTAGAQLRQSTDGSLFIKDGDSTITVTSPDGGYVDFDYNETFTSGSFETKAIAAQKVGNDYKIVVKETTTITGSESVDIFYTVYKLDSTGTLNWGDIVYRTAEELNESEFGQDIDMDGTISSGSATSASDTYADLVSTGTTDAETLSAIQNTAQSDIFSITNADSTSADTNIEMYVEGIEGTAKGNYEVDVKVVQTANDSLLAKAAADTGLEATDFNALTGVMDFSVTIADPDNYGKIVSMSWVLPEGTENPKYYKKDVINGEYFDFVYDSTSGEGAQWDAATRTLKVSVRDNGKYDSNNTLGVVKDPGFISSGADKSNPLLSITFPADNATAAPNNANLELTFSEKVDVETGNIVIKKRSDDSVVETIDVTNKELVTGTGTNKITVNPAADLALDTEYYIQIDATAFDDKAGNSFAGITDKTTFSFKTSSTDIAPTLISATPADDATSASHLSNIELSFSEAVNIGTGNITIFRKSDDAVIEAIDITNSSLVTGGGTNIITIDPSAELESGTEYYVQIASNALVDSGNNAYAGISDKISLSFTTSPYLFTSTSDDQVIAYTGKSYAQSSSDLTIGSLTYKIYSFDGEISADKFYNVRSVYATSISEAANENVTLNNRALDFQLTVQTPDGASVGESSLVVFDTQLVADSLSVTDESNNRDSTKYWTYYSVDDSGTISALNYDPIKNAGAKFFDTSGDGIADAVHLELIDGGYGDKDGLVNGVIKDPSVAGTATLNPDFAKVDTTTLNIVDSTKASTPATLVLNASLDLTTRTNSVNEIGYVVLDSGESSLTIDQFKARARTLFNSLENNDVTLTTTTDDLYSQELFIANNQSIKLFKVSDGSISDITSLTDSNFSYFSIDTLANDSTLMKTADGMSVTLTTTSVDPGLNELIGNLQCHSNVLDFASVPEKIGSISGTLEYAREADFDSVIGFYRVADEHGGVIDSVTGNVIKTSDANYKDYALASSNLVTELANISIADDQTESKEITIDENSIIAPYAISNGETWFAFGSANSDGISHFKTFGTNSFGLEDIKGGGDKDYDDFIFKFDFNIENT